MPCFRGPPWVGEPVPRARIVLQDRGYEPGMQGMHLEEKEEGGTLPFHIQSLA